MLAMMDGMGRVTAQTTIAGMGPSDVSIAAATNLPPSNLDESAATSSLWNWHLQNTVVVQSHGRFPALYSGPQSLTSTSETKQTVSLDVFAGFRLWPGAELHADALVWQGFGLSDTLGIAGFPNNEAFKGGTELPGITFAHLLVQQIIGLGGGTEDIPDGPLQLAKTVDTHRLTLVAGKMSAKDLLDGNTFSNDGRIQFMNWALVSAGAWDFPSDALGYIPGFVADLHWDDWSWRYGFFQVPRVANGLASDPHFFEAWGMVTEVERRWSSGAVRLLLYANRANMRRFDEIADPSIPRDPNEPPQYHIKPGIGLNVEQKITPTVGVFSRINWNNGETESWAYTDIDRSATLGVSINGTLWDRPNDTLGLAGVLDGISGAHRGYLAAGGMGITVGDGALRYGTEAILETYYDAQIWKTLHLALDYSFIQNPAYNQDRGPVSVFAGRVHWEY
jgi:high affinity Mn2+ porin